MHYKGVIFDIDATLGDTLPLSIRSFQLALEPLIGRPLSPKEITETFGPTEEGTVKTLAPGFVEEGLKRYYDNYVALHSAICDSPHAGVVDLLSKLTAKGTKLAVVTGKAKKSAFITLKHFKIDHYFSEIETGSPLRSIKDISIGNVLRSWNSSNKDEVVYVGDSGEDMIASKRQGIQFVLARWYSRVRINTQRVKPDFVFNDFSVFSAWILENA